MTIPGVVRAGVAAGPDRAAETVSAGLDAPGSQPQRTVLIAHPSPDVYGADLQMLQTVDALVGDGCRVVVVLPQDGRLVPMVRDHGAEVRFMPFPVLRKAYLTPRSIGPLIGRAIAATVTARRMIRSLRPTAVIVNTVTLPWWILAARLAGTPALCHLHEAETEVRRLVRRALVSPLFLATAVIVISRAAMAAMTDVAPRLRHRAHLVYNGVPEPSEEAEPVRPAGRRARLLVIGRLSPRKAPDVVLEVTAQLVARGLDVEAELAGTAFEGYEWYEESLRRRAAAPDLDGRVVFAGYCSPIWPVLARADVVVQPSGQEPFGLAVVEAQYALRPVVATGAAGHLESITDGETGLLATPSPTDALVTTLADRVAELLADPAAAVELAERARTDARRRFSVDRYHREIADLVRRVGR